MKEKIRKFATILLFVWIIFFIGIGAFYYFVIMPQKSKLTNLFAKVEYEIETNLVAAQAKEERAKKLMDEKMVRACQLLNNFLIDKEEVNNLVFDFKKLADDSDISDFTGSHDPSSSYTKMAGLENILEGSMRMNFSGDYNNFIKLVNNLERYQPVVFVDRFDISRIRKNSASSNMNITLTFFVESEEK